MKRALVGVALVGAMATGVVIGASIRPALAGDADDRHRIAIATELIGRQMENVSRHLEGMQRCACK